MTTARTRGTRTGLAIAALISMIGALLTMGLVTAAPAGAAYGDLDPSFSGDGVQQVSGTGTQPILMDVATGPDGSSTIVGSNDTNGSDGHLVLARLLADGTPDAAFGGGDGLVELTTAQFTVGQSVTLAPDGKILVVGWVGQPAKIAVARFNPDGTLDSTFDGDGLAAIDAPGAQDLGYGIALDPGGRVLIAAETNDSPAATPDFHFVTTRLSSAGALDTSFGTGGFVVEESNNSDGARAVAVDADGRILVGGALGRNAETDGVVIRYTDTGARDATFGTGGLAVVHTGAPSDSAVVQGIVVDGNSPIVAVASGNPFDPNAAVHRLTPAGAADPAFGGGDGAVAFAGPDGEWAIGDLDRRADGYLVAAGTEFGPTTTMGQEVRGAVAQFTPAGALDSTFSGDGLTTIDLGDTDEAASAAYDVDGRPVIVGSSTTGTARTGTVVRLQNHTRQANLPAGGSLSTGSEATPGNPVVTTVTTPNAGLVSITERRTAPSTNGAFSMLGVAVDITAPDATPANPLNFTFRLDRTLVDGATTAPFADDVAGLAVFRNGAQLADCSSSAGAAADPDPCLASKTLDGDDVVLAVRTSKASTWTFGVGPVGAPRYWMAASDGGVFTFGQAAFFGSTGDIKLNSPVVGMTVAPDGKGYWMVAADGGVFSFGSAEFYGSMGATKLNQPIVGMASAPDGKGYWLVAADGGIFSFGSAQFFGSTGNLKLNQPIVGISAAPDGQGYWMVAKDGGIFTFGSADFFGSTGNLKLNQPIVGMTATPGGQGYWLVASDGGIFTFGDAAFLGSTGDIKLNKPIVTMAVAPGGSGYWMFASDGGVFSFGTAPFLGSLGDIRLNQPVVAGAA